MIRHFRFVGGACVFAVAVIAFFAAALPAHAESRLDVIRDRGYVNCGVGASIVGFSRVDSKGQWSGFDVEYCAALAAAVFGSRDAVKFRNIHPADRFKSLADGEVDVLLRGSPWTLTRDAELGARFVGVTFYDGQGFLVPRGHAIISVLELSGASVCVLPGSSGERSVTDYFGQKKMRFQLVTSEDWSQLVKTYGAGGCTTLTGDLSLLAAERSRLAIPDDHMLLPELVDKSPLGPVVKTGDDQWFAIVRWTYMALIGAEEMGLTQGNVESMKTSTVIDVRRFLGLEGDLGAPLGLAKDWAYQVVRQVGNYGEIFERTLGQGSPLKLQRGLNDLWSKGGLMYAAPFR